MTETYKVLGQAFPAATTLTALYTVPGATKAVVSSITACNQHATDPGTIRLSIAKLGAADAAKQYIWYDINMPLRGTRDIVDGIGLEATDVIRVYSSHGAHAFNAWGVEVT